MFFRERRILHLHTSCDYAWKKNVFSLRGTLEKGVNVEREMAYLARRRIAAQVTLRFSCSRCAAYFPALDQISMYSLVGKYKCIFSGLSNAPRIPPLPFEREPARRAQYAIPDYHNVGCQACVYAFARAWHPSPSATRFKLPWKVSTDSPDVPCCTFSRRGGPLPPSLCAVVGTRLSRIHGVQTYSFFILYVISRITARVTSRGVC